MTPDEQLLVAAFGGTSRAVVAWDDWSRGRDLAKLDAMEIRLLPAVYQNLRDAGRPDGEIAPFVKELARSLWVRTQVLLRDAAATVTLLSRHDIHPVLLKGAALVAGRYSDVLARPMSDFDLLVKPAEALAVTDLLASAHWQPVMPMDRHIVTYRHSLLFRKPGAGCDLHWRTLWESHDGEADDRLMHEAEPATLHGVAVRVPRPEHLLLQVIVHGTRSFHPAVRWIGDALAVLRKRGHDLDWLLFVREAETRRLEYPAGEALTYLAAHFDALVPSDVLTHLGSRRVSRAQRRMYFVGPRPPKNGKLLFARAVAYVLLRRPPARMSLLKRAAWTLRSLQDVLAAPTLAGLAVVTAQKILRLMLARRQE